MSNRNEASRSWMMVRRLWRDEGGLALASVALLGTTLIILTSVVVMNMLATTRSVGRDRGWEQAIHVAEGGVDEIFRAIDAEETVNQTTAGTPLATREEVVAAAAAFAVTASPEGEFVSFINSDEDKAYAVGYEPTRDSATASVRAVEVEYVALDNFRFSNGAITAGGNATMNGTGATATDPPTEHQASVYTNGDFTGNGANPFADGDIAAAGTASGGTAYGSYTGGADPVEFPTQAEIDAWQAELKAEAQTGPTYGNITTSQVITAPAYISGNINLSGPKTLTLLGPGVIYVEGDVTLSGPSTITNSEVVLAMSGNYDMAAQSTYEVTGDITLAALISFSTSIDAIKVTGGGAAVTMGTVWAANGGVTLSGNADFYGAILAATDVVVTGSSGIIYPAFLNENSQVGPTRGPTIGRQREL